MDYQELFEQADNLRNTGKINEAVKAYAGIVEIATKNKDNHEIAEAWHMAGVSAEMAADGEDQYFHSALNSYNHAEKEYTFLQDMEGLGALCRDVGKLYTKVASYSKAKEWLERSIEILTATEAYGQLAISYDKLALYYSRTGNFPQAQDNFVRALELFTKDPEAGFFRATTLHDSARVYAKFGETEKACDQAEESLSWFMADHAGEKYDYRLAELNGLLSIVYYRLSEPDKAKQAGEKFEILIKTMSPEVVRNITNSLNELGN